jgi:hypothetical protein
MVRILVEGGGDAASLKAECRRAFSELLKKAGFAGKMPSVRAEGGRADAFDAFRVTHAQVADGEFIILLVDSEEIPATDDPWLHLKSRDDWDKPAGATDDQAHLMVVSMETWLIADAGAFAAYFGKGVRTGKLPSARIEAVSKHDVLTAINAATATATPKGKYGKARDSFKLLSQVAPAKLQANCAWARRFFEAVERHT